ncbi:MAG: hypothetical protein AAGF76_10275 [Pseudomonadota bacterium]
MLTKRLREAEDQIAGLLDRIVTASNDRVIGAYEDRIDALEREKLVLTEKLAKTGQPERPFAEMFELALGFLANPCNLWKSDRFADKQTVQRLVFEGRLTYCRNGGFRTPKTNIIFKALEDISTIKSAMAESEGETSNSILDTLAEWNDQLKQSGVELRGPQP